LSRLNKRKLIGLFLFGVFFYWSFPNQLFDAPYSTVLNDDSGHLLSAKIAKDGQWRFPDLDSVPYALEECILHFEDEYFYMHPGVNPVSIGRAIEQNIEQEEPLVVGLPSPCKSYECQGTIPPERIGRK